MNDNTPKLDAALVDLAKTIEHRLSDTQTQSDPDFARATRQLNFTLRMQATIKEELEKCRK
jgi:hypothetical protein